MSHKDVRNRELVTTKGRSTSQYLSTILFHMQASQTRRCKPKSAENFIYSDETKEQELSVDT